MENRQVKRIKSGHKRSIIELPEEIWVEIMARLPFINITRLKTVCKGWRELIETTYFRRAFMFAHRNSSTSWSIMHETSGWLYGEVVGFNGCERYGIPRSLDSYIPSHDELVGQITIIACVDGLVLLEDISSNEAIYRVGNPVLNQWVQLPPHPSKELNTWIKATSLVTRVEDGVIVEYKVVFMDGDCGNHVVEALSFEIYSSKTGKWISKRVCCPRIVSLNYKECLSMNKKLHWIDEHGGAFITYDFFAIDEESHQCRLIPFPIGETLPETHFERAYSTSGGFLVYISKINFRLRIWKLEEYTSDSERWQLMQNINLIDKGEHYFPLAMHPFENHIIYMTTWIKRRLVSVDLKTQEYTHHTKSAFSDAILSHYFGDGYYIGSRFHKIFYVPQFILPKWMGSVPPLPSV